MTYWSQNQGFQCCLEDKYLITSLVGSSLGTFQTAGIPWDISIWRNWSSHPVEAGKRRAETQLLFLSHSSHTVILASLTPDSSPGEQLCHMQGGWYLQLAGGVSSNNTECQTCELCVQTGSTSAVAVCVSTGQQMIFPGCDGFKFGFMRCQGWQ